MINKSESITGLAAALVKAQGEIENPKKTAKVDMTLKSGRVIKYNYSTLDDLVNVLKKPLLKHGLAYFQNVETNGHVKVSTVIIHESGEWIESGAVTFDCTGNDPQGIGSLITYGRRYSLSSAFGVAAEEDDDCNNEKAAQMKQQAHTPSKNTVNKDTGEIILPPYTDEDAPPFEDIPPYKNDAQFSEAEPPKMGSGRTGAVISEAQSRRMFAISGGNTTLIDEVLEQYGYTSSKDVLKSDYETICNEIEQQK